MPHLYWLAFGAIVLILLATDLYLFNPRQPKNLLFKQSLYFSIFYILIAWLFGFGIYYFLGTQKAYEYFTGYLLEKTMSVDNIFVMSIIFQFYNIPSQYQHKILFWGIIGVIIFRALMISLGVAIIAKASWLMFIFAFILIYTGFKMLQAPLSHQQVQIQDLKIYQLLTKYLPIIPTIDGRFIVNQSGKLFLTPMFLALITIETMDLIFAIDSVPAIFAITLDPFIIYSSNIFAILGLRALYFCLEQIIQKYRYMKYALAIILILIGGKILISHYLKIPAYMTLLVITTIFIASIALSSLTQKSSK